MRLDELFDDDFSGENFVEYLRDICLDILMPLAAHGVPKVSIQKIIDKLRDQQTGVEVDRALVMNVLDPDEVKLVQKIEGDSVFFKLPDANSRETTQSQEEKDKKHVASKAQKQAKKAITDTGPLG